MKALNLANDQPGYLLLLMLLLLLLLLLLPTMRALLSKLKELLSTLTNL
jgi:ABC-type sulfate transport system permease component